MRLTIEKDFQIALGKTLKKLGFEVFLDKKICELPSFTGDREKPDLLIFYKKDLTTHEVIKLENPFAIECKQSNKLSSITKSVLQTKKYNGKRYHAGEWSGEIKNILLTTPLCFKSGNLYEWALGNKDFNDGLNWGLIHMLFCISNKSGIILKEDDELLIRFHNCNFKMDNKGIITRPSKRTYHPIKQKRENEST